LIRLAVRVAAEQAEVVLAELLELAPSGVEEVAVSDGIVEYAVYGPPGELPALPDVRAAAGGALVEVSTTEVADDWSERWREFHRPLVLDGLTVCPPWERTPASSTNSIEIMIDPGQAFGTGAHATTRLCLELLLDLDKSPAGRIALGNRPGDDRPGPAAPGRFALVDLGCGSGVLAIAAARLGWRPVLALDYDPAAVTATAENAALNGVAIEVRRHDLRIEGTPPAATVTANLLGPLLIEWAGRMTAGPDELPAQIIASGLLERESAQVEAAFAGPGFFAADRRIRGDWAALLLTRS
jgi:ribosomal protein L11 methyltransferase